MTIFSIEPSIQGIVDHVGVNREHIISAAQRPGDKQTLVIRVPNQEWADFSTYAQAIGIDRNVLLQAYVIIFLDYYQDYLTNTDLRTGKAGTHYLKWLKEAEDMVYRSIDEDKGRSIRLNTSVLERYASLCQHLDVSKALFLRYFIVKAAHNAKIAPLWGAEWGGEEDSDEFTELAKAINQQMVEGTVVNAVRSCEKTRYPLSVPEVVRDELRKNAKKWGFSTMNHYIVELILADLCKRGYSVVR